MIPTQDARSLSDGSGVRAASLVVMGRPVKLAASARGVAREGQLQQGCLRAGFPERLFPNIQGRWMRGFVPSDMTDCDATLFMI
jgi:hypothetical protein